MSFKKNIGKICGIFLVFTILFSLMAPAIQAESVEPEDASAVIRSEITPSSSDDVSIAADPSSIMVPAFSEEEPSAEEPVVSESVPEEAVIVAAPQMLLADGQNIFASLPFGVTLSGLTSQAHIILPENIQFVEGYGAEADESGRTLLLTPQQDGSDILFTLSAMDNGNYTLSALDQEEQTLCDVSFTVNPPRREARTVTGGDSSLSLKVGDGVSGFVDVDTIGNRIEWPYTTKTKQIQITANFGPAGDEKDRSLEILVPRGYTIKGYSAKTDTQDMNGVVKIALSQQDESKVASVTLTAADGSSWLDQRVLGYTGQSSVNEAPKRVYDGKLHYAFNNQCEEITITVTLGLDQSVMPHNASIAELNPLTVKETSGSTIINSQFITAVSGIAVPSLSLSNLAGSRNVVGEPDQNNPDRGTIAEFETSYSTSSYINGESQFHLAEDVTLEIAYPAGLTLTGFAEKVTNTPKISLDQIDFSSNKYETNNFIFTHDPVNRIVTFRFKNVTIGHVSGSLLLSCFWTGVVDNANIKWDVPLVFKATYKETSGLSANNQQIHNSVLNNTLTITPQKPGYRLRLTPRNLTRRDLNGYADGNYPYDYMLGQFTLINDGPNDATDLLYTFAFHENLHVRGVALPGLVGDTYEKITALTNTGRQIELNNITVTNTNRTGPGVTLDSARLGLAADEYLLSIEVEQVKLTAGNYTPFGVYSVISYFGRFQNGQGGPVTLKIFDNADAGNPVLLVSSVDTTKLGWTNYSSTTSVRASLTASSTKAADGSGDGSFFPNAELKFVSKYTDMTGNTSVFTQNDGIDPTVQISLPPGIELDASSVQGKALAGNYHGALFDLKLVGTGTKVINGETWAVYTFTGYNKLDLMSKAGHYFSSAVDPAGSFEMYIYFTAHVSSASKTYTGLQASDIFVWDFGQGVINGKVAPTASTPINIVQKPGLKVSIGIRTQGSDTPFHTYNGQESSIAPLNPQAPAELWLEYENTDSTSYKAGTEIYLPIPKKGHMYSAYFNNIEITDPVGNPAVNKAPSWDSYLSEPISLPGFTTYYTTDTSFAVDTSAQDSSWTPDDGYIWSTAPPSDLKTVTMVKFIADADISSNMKGQTTFGITVSDDANLGTQNFWRPYQKGWRDASGSGTWMYGSIVAAEPSMNGVQGMLFLDKNANGAKDTGEDFANTGGTQVTAVLTGTNISPLTLTMHADGSFQSLNPNQTLYFLKAGTYTIQFTNGTNSVMGFTPATSGTASSAAAWKMDILQNKIATDQASAAFTFTIDSSMTTSMTQYVGLGLVKSPIITYNAGTGASFVQTSESVIYNRSPKSNPNIYSNYITGYNPDSVVWVLDKDVVLGGNSVTAGTELTTAQLRSISLTSDITATANLKATEYNITYVLEGGTAGASSPASYNITSTFPLSIPSPQKSNYTFNGWTVDYANTSIPDITAPVSSYSIPASTFGDLTLTAHWTAIPYTVTYHGNGNTAGAAPADTATYTAGQSAAVLGQNTLVRDRYTFSGWDTSSTATAAQYQENDTLTIEANTDLYAVWTLDTFTVKFFSNEGTTPQEYLSNRLTDVPRNTTISAPPTDPARAGYVFAGWYTSQVGVNPGAADKWNFATDAVTAETSLYAGWNSYSYTVTYKLNDDTSSLYQDQSVASPDTIVGALPADPQRTGYTFTGWYTIPAQTGGTQFTASTLVTGDIEVYARWVDSSVPNDVLSGKGVVLYVEEVALMSKSSYIERGLASAKRTLHGLVSDISSADIAVDFSQVQAREGIYDVTFTSQYNGFTRINVRVIEHLYPIVYRFNNGAEDVSATSYAGRLVTNPGEPTKNGYTFDGWYLGEKKWDFARDVMPAEPLELHARYTAIPATSSSSSPVPVTSSSSSAPPVPSSSSSTSRSSSSSSSKVPPSSVSFASAASSTDGESSSPASSRKETSSSRQESSATLSAPSGSAEKADNIIQTGSIPLGGITMKGVWSLLNLILSALCILLFASLLWLYFGKQYKQAALLALANLVLAVGTLLLFIFSTDFHLQMVFINHLTLLFVLLTGIQIVLLYLYQKENKKRIRQSQNNS